MAVRPGAARGYVAKAGDIVGLAFDPQAGHEQAGHRPAVVLSPAAYNGRTGLMLCCPTTTRIKGYPFEVRLAGAPPSVALADQIKSLDWRARRAGSLSAARSMAARARLRISFAPVRGSWTRMASSICAPMRRTGFSAVIGS